MIYGATASDQCLVPKIEIVIGKKDFFFFQLFY